MAPSAYKGSEKPRFHYAIRADEWLIRVKIEVAKDYWIKCQNAKLQKKNNLADGAGKEGEEGSDRNQGKARVNGQTFPQWRAFQCFVLCGIYTIRLKQNIRDYILATVHWGYFLIWYLGDFSCASVDPEAQ